MKKYQKLWNKKTTLHHLIEEFTSKEDLAFDQRLIPYDVYGNLAHVQMLCVQGLMSKAEYEQIREALVEILKLYTEKKYALQFGDEDVHTRIENDLSAVYPQAGGKIHTGRSRNDQVLTDLRLYTKDHCHMIATLAIELAGDFLLFAKKYEFVPMPGYTHMQLAMLSSVGLWASQFAESLLDDLLTLQHAYELSDQSPLGSGAAYGVSVPLDRRLTQELLGFKRLQINALYCQNSRGKIEATVLCALSSLMSTMARFAQDVLMFTMSEFAFFEVPAEITTGSSIMPQKKNVDVLELVRAKAKTVASNQHLVSSISLGLISGYNRDLQEMKKPYMESFDTVLLSLQVLHVTLAGLHPNEANMRKAITPELFAAHHAYLVMESKKLPFREAYRLVGENLSQIPEYDPEDVIAKTATIGAPGCLLLDETTKKLAVVKSYWTTQYQSFQKSLQLVTVNTLGDL